MDRLKEHPGKLLWYYDKKGMWCFIAGCIIYVHEFKAKSTAHTLTRMGVYLPPARQDPVSKIQKYSADRRCFKTHRHCTLPVQAVQVMCACV